MYLVEAVAWHYKTHYCDNEIDCQEGDNNIFYRLLDSFWHFLYLLVAAGGAAPPVESLEGRTDSVLGPVEGRSHGTLPCPVGRINR